MGYAQKIEHGRYLVEAQKGKLYLQVVDEEYVEEVEKAAPFAFDLGREYELSRAYGNSYKPFFIENAHYYAKESYARVPISEYEHDVKRYPDGRVELAFGVDNVSAKARYLAPAMDESKPEWYRRRAYADVVWTEKLERLLESAKTGDVFLDLSPTEFNVNVSERKKWGYGYHSFARIHTLVTENGQEKLVSRAIRNYLNEAEQKALFERLTGEEIDTKELLGEVRKISESITPAHIRKISDELYEQTPEAKKIIPPREELENIKAESEMDLELAHLDVWLEAVFEMMEQGEDPELVLTLFRAWEAAVKDAVEGDGEADRFSSITKQQIVMAAIYNNNAFIGDYLNRQYVAGYNGCGLGSGFGQGSVFGMNQGNIERFNGPMTYQTMTQNEDKNSCPEIKCGRRGCSWKANDTEAEKIQKGELTCCPKCKWRPDGKKEKESNVVDINVYKNKD